MIRRNSEQEGGEESDADEDESGDALPIEDFKLSNWDNVEVVGTHVDTLRQCLHKLQV